MSKKTYQLLQNAASAQDILFTSQTSTGSKKNLSGIKINCFDDLLKLASGLNFYLLFDEIY